MTALTVRFLAARPVLPLAALAAVAILAIVGYLVGAWGVDLPTTLEAGWRRP